MSLASRIEHTLLRADATRGDVREAWDRAVAWGCHGVCVQPAWVPELAGRSAPMRVVTVAGFPHGAVAGAIKAATAARAVGEGADEIDMVFAVGLWLSADEAKALAEVAQVRRVVGGATLKVIMEVGLFDADATELVRAARQVVDSGADFLKTCSGFGPRGAHVDDVARLAPLAPVKASGGIGSPEAAQAMVAAGAARLGVSRTAAVLES